MCFQGEPLIRGSPFFYPITTEVDTMKPSLDKLSSYVAYYIHRVIGLDVKLTDSAQPCSINSKDPIIELPMTKETLGEFLGEDFVDHAPVELLFAIVVGLAYHEAAHLKSGEPHVQPHILDNVINDANDFTFVPDTWKGAMSFTISLINMTYRQGMDLGHVPQTTREEKLQTLIHLAVTYMRKLRIRNNGKDVRSIPDKHELAAYFARITPIVRAARKVPVTKRPDLVKQLYEVLKDFWDNSQAPCERGMTLDQALDQSNPMISIELSAKDAASLKKSLEKLGTIQKAAGELTRTLHAVIRIEQEEEKKQTQEAMKRIAELGDLGSQLGEAQPDPDADPVSIDHGIVRKLRQTLRPLLQDRAISRRTPAVVGSRFAPSRFHEIKTRPDEPRIRKEVKRIGKTSVETGIILCFDRSGSMSGDKEQTCKEIAGSLYEAIRGIPQASTSIMGFDTTVDMIIDTKNGSREQAMKRIASGLSARGGTNFPLAFYQAIIKAIKKTARKKIITMLTDGDITGNIHIDDLVRFADHHQLHVMVIGIQGSDEERIQHWFGKERTLYVENVSLLPTIMARTIKRLI